MSENDSFYSSEHFQAFFKTSGRSLVLKADSPLFTVLAVSDQYLTLMHKERSEVLNKGLFDVFPGGNGALLNSFNRVISSGAADELPTFRSDAEHWATLNEPLLDGAGIVTCLINTTTNITEASQMKEAYGNEQEMNEELLISNENLAFDNAQLGIEQQILQELIAQLTASEAKVEQAEMTLRLAMEAANVGTWYIHCPDQELRASKRLKELFGFYPEDQLTLAGLLLQVTDDHRERVKAGIEQAILTPGPYDEAYPVLGFHDHTIRWVRALGNTSVQHGDFLAFTGVILDITGQKEDEQRKNDFISMVSHELKSPLTSLSGYTQILGARAKNSDDSFATSTLDKMNGQVKKMTGMINGFLSKGHLESGKIHLQFSEFNLEDLVNELIDEARLSVTTHVINIGQCDTVLVFADRDKIGNVLSNLLSNAVKYSPNGQYIEVNCAVTGDRVQVSVKDEGLGITEKDRINLFERYNRIKTEHTEKIAGFGIGLYLCAEIVRRHQGAIWVESEPGSGSTFYFNLPMVPAAPNL